MSNTVATNKKQKPPAPSAIRKESGPSARKAKNRDRNEAARMANLKRKEEGIPTARQARALKRAADPMVQQRKADHERARAKVLAEAKAKGDAEARKRRAERFANEASYVLASAAETMRRIHAA